MTEELVLPVTYVSPTTQRKTQYVYLESRNSSEHIVLSCYGAGGRSVDLNRYQSFLRSHDSMSLLCIDRGVQGPSCSRYGPDMLNELADLMAEVLDHLNIKQVSLIFHSAGAYQALSFAARHPDRVYLAFPACAHLSFMVTDSRLMRWVVKAPEPILKFVSKLDGGPIGKFVLTHFLSSPNDERLITSPHIEQQLEKHQMTDLENQMYQERYFSDYNMCFDRYPGLPSEKLLDLYYDCPKDLVWFSTTKEVFFDPKLIKRITPNFRKAKVECIEIEGAIHGNIQIRKDVWEEIYRRIQQ